MDHKTTAFTDKELEKGILYLERLKEKYEGIGQDFFDYLEGLVQSNGLSYWDYIHLNSLLGLQSPRTNHPDEMIFIMYHQITELYFKLIKHELEQLTDPEVGEYLELEKWHLRISRATNYFKHLCNSFDIMHSGMDFHQFRQFRMALLPASGFQSVQFRHVEIMSTNLHSLLQAPYREQTDQPLEKLYDKIYWKAGALETQSGQMTLTLRQFEEKYDRSLQQFINHYRYRNLNYLYYRLPKEIKADERLRTLLRDYDVFVNNHWRLGHLASAARYLPMEEEGTGGTNWRKYLPPKFQKIVFFESLWTSEELDEWGKAAIVRIFREKVRDKWMEEGK